MPALFWLIVAGLALAVGLAAVQPWLKERTGEAQAPGAVPARPPWVGPMVMLVGGFVVMMIGSFLFPNFPFFLLFLPLVWFQRRRRGPKPPTQG